MSPGHLLCEPLVISPAADRPPLFLCLCCRKLLESKLEKKAGINYGPPGTKSLIYFVDDLNMPQLDKYETAMPISLIRQHLGWGHWYDRAKLTLKNINNTQYIACMNPTAGSFIINPR